MATTSPDDIFYVTGLSPESREVESSDQASSIQRAFDKRQRYDFVWANATERDDQTGMVQGSRGYQADSKTEYIYDNLSWRLATAHIEFTATKAIGSASGIGIVAGNFSIVSASSTDQTMAYANGDGIIRIVNPGLYSVSAFVTFSAGFTQLGFVQLSTNNSPNIDAGRITRGVHAPGDDTATLSMPNLRILTADQPTYWSITQQSGSTLNCTTRLRITRIA